MSVRRIKSLPLELMRRAPWLLAFVLNLSPGCRDKSDEWAPALAEVIAAGPGTTIDLRKIVTSQWDSFFVFPPYTEAREVHGTLGFRWRGAERSGIASSDAINLLVFVADKRVVSHAAYPRGKGDFYRAARPQGYTPATARFVVQQEGQLVNGEPHLVLIPAR